MFIRVKAKEGRVAYTAPRGGDLIPTDQFKLVEATPWIMRLLNVHGDIEQEPAAKPVPKDAGADTSAKPAK